MTSIITDEWADDDGDAAAAPRPPAPAPPVPANEPTGKRSKKKNRKNKPEEEPPQLAYRTVEEFVTNYLAKTIRRNVNGSQLTWCPEWWRHPEALSRLTAVWRAWENLRLDPALGISTWWLSHCDPHLRALMDPETGPLSACKPTEHGQYGYEPLQVTAADPALWLSPAFSATPTEDADD